MNTNTKNSLRGVVVVVGAVGLLVLNAYREGIESRKYPIVVRRSYELALGNDVSLSTRGGTTKVLYIGTMDEDKFVGAYLEATDNEMGGTIEDYSLQATAECRGDHESKAYARNLVLTALGESKVCEREVALLKLADRDTLNKIERELLPYSGKNGVADGTRP